MSQVSLLDCTLRDGGYVNSWRFGEKNIKTIVNKLIQSGIEVVECGYLSASAISDPDSTRFRCMEDILKLYPHEKGNNQRYAVMVNFGEYPVEDLPLANERSPIVRLAFHKKDLEEAFRYAERLERLGYVYYMQPMGALNYTDAEYISLIDRVNHTNAEAFYIVDSFGVMELPDFKRLVFLADHNLREDTTLGYHSHNNLQQAYSNSKCMVELNLRHRLILDASVFGMGRGAGNLNIELFARYLNQTEGKQYDIEPFLEIFDECLKPVFISNFWGYSLPFYLSSIHNCHPNYANYFNEMNTLTVKSINELLSMLTEEDKISYSKEKADRYYLQYQEHFVDDAVILDEIREVVSEKNILILAPGSTLNTHEESVQQFIQEQHPVVFGINMPAEQYRYDYLFLVNEKRYTSVIPENVKQRILTSNIRHIGENDLCVNYTSYLITESKVRDNPTLMLMKLLRSVGVKEVYIAGMDGFSVTDNNYFSTSMALGTKTSTKVEKNQQIALELSKMNELMTLHFLTPSTYCEEMS